MMNPIRHVASHLLRQPTGEDLADEYGKALGGLRTLAQEIEAAQPKVNEALARRLAAASRTAAAALENIDAEEEKQAPPSLQAHARRLRDAMKGLISVLDLLENINPTATEEDRPVMDELLASSERLLLAAGAFPTARTDQPLDIDYHCVLGTEETAGQPPDVIIRVVRNGYKMTTCSLPEEIILRYADVIISRPAENDGPDDNQSSTPSVEDGGQ